MGAVGGGVKAGWREPKILESSENSTAVFERGPTFLLRERKELGKLGLFLKAEVPSCAPQVAIFKF